MTHLPRQHPDLLRRFVATPYVFIKLNGADQIAIESNDLEIALNVRNSGAVQRQANRAGGLFCRLIRDVAGPVDGSETSIISDGVLRILLLGRGTILIHDHEKSELLGFVSRNVSAQDLASSLIPAVLGT